MRSVFRSKFKVTQGFGVNSDYYKKFGLKAHEGIDLIPTGSVWDILCPEDGVVVRDVDDAPTGKNYGKNFTIWHPNSHRASQYCHLNSNNIKVGDLVKVGQVLGIMGDTGNTQGAHLHLNLFHVDDNGYRLNKDNGFLGGVDPLEWLNEGGEPSPTIPVLSDVFENLVRKSTGWDKVIAKLNVEDSETVVLGEIEKNIGYEDAVAQKDREIADAQTKIAQLDSDLKMLQKVHETMRVENATLTQEVKEQEETITKQGEKITSLSGALEELKESIKNPVYGLAKVIQGIKELFGRK